MENLFCLYQKMPKALSCRFMNTENDRFGIGKSGTMMLIYFLPLQKSRPLRNYGMY